ncbi:MAG: hypothetical protein AB8G11_03185 [Saprospiraceae bacterium]
MKMLSIKIIRTSLVGLLALLISSFNYNNYVYKPDNVEYVQKVNEALAKVIDAKYFTIADGDLSSDDDGTTLSSSAEIFKENNVGIEATFDVSDQAIKKIKATFSPNTALKSRFFNKLTGRKEKQIFPDDIRKRIYTQSFEITFENNEPKTLSVGVNTNEKWNPFDGVGNFALKGIEGIITLRNPKGKTGMSATLTGSFSVSNTEISVSGQIGSSPEDYILKSSLKNLNITDVLKTIAGSAAFGGISMPSNALQVQLNDGELTIAPRQKMVSINGSSTFGRADFVIKPLETKQLSFVGGYSPPNDFPFSSIHSSLSILDDFPFENTAFVFASHNGLSTNLPVFKKVKFSRQLQKGFTFVAAYDLKEVGLDELLKVNQVGIYANLPANPLGFSLLANLDMRIPISKEVDFRRVDLRIQPKDLSVEIGAALGVKIQQDDLVFGVTGGVEGKDLVLSVAGYMEGSWNNPLGVKGVVISDVYGKIGISFRTTPIPLPEIAISGKLKVDEFQGDMTVAMNANNPSESMLDIGFNEINIKKIVEKYCSPSVKNQIPTEFRQVVMDIGMKDARLTIVPTPVTIANKNYEPGFRAAGTTTIAGQSATLDVTINYNSGIKAYADLDPISHPPFFELKGGRGKPKPFVDIILEPSTNSKFQISGSATVLGITSETDVLLNNKGFEFYMNGKVFDAFQASLNVYGGDINNGGTIGAKAEMKTNFIETFTKEASDEIDKATKQTQNDIQSAQNTLTREQRKFDQFNRDLAAMRRTIEAERKRDNATFEAAKRDVTNAQNEVNRLQNDINRLNSQISQHKKNISNANPLNLIYIGEETGHITYKGTQVAGLETAKGAANLTLDGYRETLKLIQKGIKHFPIDTDPRMVALYTARDVPKGMIEAAKYTLEFGKGVGVGTLTAAKWIVENSSKILIVEYAMFEGKVNAMHGGKVRMRVKGTYMGEKFDKYTTFNFDSPVKAMEDFANSML